jgi:hypothetical protein
MGTTAIQVKVGTEFRSVYADSNPLWRVTRIDGDVVHAVIVNEPIEIDGRMIDSDWVGRRDLFYMDRVVAALEWEERIRATIASADEFFDGLELGAIVHYHNGFGEWVRCRVVEYDHDFRTGPSEYKAGQKVLLPIALVGNWDEHDLPHERRDMDGTVHEVIPYHAKKVLTMDGAWRPAKGCVWESGECHLNPRFPQDPSTLEPLDLTMRRVQP